MDTYSPPCPHCATPAAHPTTPGSFYCEPCGSDFGWEEAKDAVVRRSLRLCVMGCGTELYPPNLVCRPCWDTDPDAARDAAYAADSF